MIREKPVSFMSYGRQVNGVIDVDTDRKRIQIWCEDEEIPGYTFPYANCTADIPGLKPDEWAIKNWSENEGILELLIEAGIVEAPHRAVRSGWVMVPICRIREG